MNLKEKLFGNQQSIEPCASEALNRLRHNLPNVFGTLYTSWQKGSAEAFPLLYEREISKIVIVDDHTWGKPENWFFIGDIHGDFFALYTVLTEIKKQCADFRIVFLGDLVDRGEQSIECIFLLLSWADSHPERIIWLGGNHDLAFSYNESTHEFSSSVYPSEFLDFLNSKDSLSGYRRQLGLFFIRLTENLPRAVLFPDGLFATHGGFPLVDLHEKAVALTTQEEYLQWLNTPECLQDFTWTRINKNRRRIPNRTTKGCSYGFMDFEAFCALKPELFPVKRMITGHEHPTSGWETLASYQQNPAVTITGFGFDPLLESPFKFYHYKPKLIVGRYRQNELPEQIAVEYNEIDLRKLYPLPVVPVQDTANAQIDPSEIKLEQIYIVDKPLTETVNAIEPSVNNLVQNIPE